MRRVPCLLALLLFALRSVAGEMVWENDRFRAVVSDDAAWQSLVDKTTGKNYCTTDRQTPIAAVRVGSKLCLANQAVRNGDKLLVKFSGCDTQLTYSVAASKDWIVFRLDAITGTRPSGGSSDDRLFVITESGTVGPQSPVELLRLGITLTEHVGPRLTAGWNERYAICLRAVNMQTDGFAAAKDGVAELIAGAQDGPGPKLEGAAVALIAAPSGELPGILQRLAAAYDLPGNERDGVPSKGCPTARQSYWFLGFGERDADRVIDLCRRSGIQQVMIPWQLWCNSVGHYVINGKQYPDGVESLRRTVAKLHAADVLVGMHCFASKVSKNDAYATPVPDRRLWVDRSAVVAADVGPSDTEIHVRGDLRQWPGSPVARKKLWEGGVVCHQDVIIDDELIRYRSIGPEGKWDTFLGCRRGFNGTKPAAHKAGAAAKHYGVDGCLPGYIIDQETSLLDEVAGRLAEIFNACDFDMIYFDGGEDVDRRRLNYYASKCQALVMSKLRKRPLIHMSTIMTHNLWHSFTRSGTVDTYLNTVNYHAGAGMNIEARPTVKQHIDDSVRYLHSIHDDMMPAELGWFGIWPKGGNYDGLQLDEIEYLMVKSLAHDAPISLQTSFREMEAHPLTPGILQIVGVYERLRRAGTVGPAVRRRLAELGKDFVRVPSGAENQSQPEFVEVRRLPRVADDRRLRAWIGPLQDDVIVTLWHELGRQGRLLVGSTDVAAGNILGQPVKTAVAGGQTAIPVGFERITLRFRGHAPEAVAKLLAESRFEPASLVRVGAVCQSWETRDRTVQHVLKMLDQAAAQGAQIVCLPEECVPTDGGPAAQATLEAIAQVAAAKSMMIAANLKEKQGDKLYSSSYLIGPDGKMIGKYRKSHRLPDEPIALGDELPVFDTPFGKVGLMIGTDYYWPEVPLVLALQGAELILWSHGPEPLPQGYPLDVIMRVRALDNQVVLAVANYAGELPYLCSNWPTWTGQPLGRGCVVDRSGIVEADTGLKAGVAVVPIDLGQVADVFRLTFKEDRSLFLCLVDQNIKPIVHRGPKRKVRVTIAQVEAAHGPNPDPKSEFFKILDRAGSEQPDIILMTEFAFPTDTPDAAKTFAQVAQRARKFDTYIIIGGLRDPELPYKNGDRASWAYLWDRTGKIAGKYRIAQYGGSKELPVFKTDFGVIGLILCGDIYSPEIARALALQGAEIILDGSQSWGASGQFNLWMQQARAIDNCVYMATAHYPMSDVSQRSYVIDPYGYLLAASPYWRDSVFSADVDLDAGRTWFARSNALGGAGSAGYLAGYYPKTVPEKRGDFRAVLFAGRRPELYRPIVEKTLIGRDFPAEIWKKMEGPRQGARSSQ